MRLLLFTYTVAGLYFSYLMLRQGEAQSFEDPSKTFQKFTFDLAHRGSFNISPCVKELMNCWETVRGDIICSSGGTIYESVCGRMREYCHDLWGNQDDYWHRFELMESFCRDPSFQVWT